MDEKSRLKEIFSEEKIQARVKEMARAISRDLGERPAVFIGVLTGAFVFLSDLIRELTVPMEVDFIRAASYGEATESSGTITITKDVELQIKGRDVVLVEDIVDTGLTLSSLIEHLKAKGPASLRVAVFIDKRERREKEVVLDYVGFTVASGFLVGYGLDCAGCHRELRAIYELLQ